MKVIFLFHIAYCTIGNYKTLKGDSLTEWNKTTCRDSNEKRKMLSNATVTL